MRQPPHRIVGSHPEAEPDRLARVLVQRDHRLQPVLRVAAPRAHVTERVAVTGVDEAIVGVGQKTIVNLLEALAAIRRHLQNRAVPTAILSPVLKRLVVPELKRQP